MRNIAIIAALVMFSLTACNKKPAEEPFGDTVFGQLARRSPRYQ